MGYQLAYFVIRRWTASAFSYSGLLTPLVTNVVAALVLGEPIRSTTLLGGALILGGTYVGTFKGRDSPLLAPPPTVIDPIQPVDAVAAGEPPVG